MKFGRLTVIDRAKNKGHHTRWNCICKCGNKTTSHTTSLTSGRTKSCGCLSQEEFAERNTKHGDRHEKLYSIWCGMKARCNNPKHDNYKYYGGKGIRVCKEWEKDYTKFKGWAFKNGYKEGLEIDRINNNENYEPSNCRWRTRSQQVRHRSNTIFIIREGTEKTLKEWCEIYKVNYKLAHARYKKEWSFEKIFNLS